MELTAVAYFLNTAFDTFDKSVTLLIHNLYLLAGDFFTPFFNFISLLGKGGIFLILLAAALMYIKKTRRFGTAMLIGLAIGAILTNLVLKVWIARPRPYLYDFYKDIWWTVGAKTEQDFCFPSGHTNAAFAAATAVFWVGRKKISWTAFFFGILMGMSRIYLVVHYPTDVIGGIIVGFISGSVAVIIANHLPEVYYGKDFSKKAKAVPDEVIR